MASEAPKTRLNTDPQVHISKTELAVIDRSNGEVVLVKGDSAFDTAVSVEDAFKYLPQLEELVGRVSRARDIAQSIVTDYMKAEKMTKAYVGGRAYRLVQPQGKWEMFDEQAEKLLEELADLVRDGALPKDEVSAAISMVFPELPKPYVTFHHGKLNGLAKYGEKVAKLIDSHRKRGPDPAPHIEPEK